jgi:hypothetical protein
MQNVREAVMIYFSKRLKSISRCCTGGGSLAPISPEQIDEDGRFDQTIIADHRVGFPNAGAAATQT